MTQDDDVIRTRGLSKRFGKHEALAPMELTVPRGSVFALLGHNGAGKSTLLKLLLGLIPPSAGSATILGSPVVALGSEAFRRIGYVAEDQPLPDWMTVRQFMDFLRPLYPCWNEGQLLRELDLPLDRKLKHLSRGMRMKAALASVLAFEPELILMDEPFSGLDPLVRDELIRSLLDRMNDTGTTVVISSHDLAEVETFASHIAFLHEGRLLFAEELSSLQTRFRQVTVTGAPPAAALPPEWLNAEHSGSLLRFVYPQADREPAEQAVRSAVPAAGSVESEPMSLREIFLALTRSARSTQRRTV